MHMSVLTAYKSMHCVYAGCPWRPEKGVGAPETGVRDGCESLCRCCELNLRLLEEQSVFLLDKPSLQPKIYMNFKSTEKI